MTREYTPYLSLTPQQRDLRIVDVGLPVRASRHLLQAGLHTVGQVADRHARDGGWTVFTDKMPPGFGRVAMASVRRMLDGLTWEAQRPQREAELARRDRRPPVPSSQGRLRVHLRNLDMQGTVLAFLPLDGEVVAVVLTERGAVMEVGLDALRVCPEDL